MSTAVIEEVAIDYEPKGAAADLFDVRDPEVLVEGPAGTGKGRAIGELLNVTCEENPGCRIAVIRKTRVSLSESWMVTFEEKCLPPMSPLRNGPTRAHRTSYDYENGSRIILGGMDNPTRLFSTEYDIIFWNEAQEGTENEWESLHRALRWGKLPYQQLLGDCNPDVPTHWLNQRCLKGLTRRMRSKHVDNPSLTPEYMARLAALTGVRRKRLFEGIWAAAEGQVWDNYDADRHVIARHETPEIKWHFGSIDFGYRAPGCFQVWGVDGDTRLYRVAEVYQRGLLKEFWAEAVKHFHQKYDMQAVVADSAEPESIQVLNDVLNVKRAEPFVRKADKTKGRLYGYNLVRSGLDVQSDKKPRMFLVRDSNWWVHVDEETRAWELRQGVQPELRGESQPCNLEEEIPALVHGMRPDGTPSKDEGPDRNCIDHAADAACYAAVFAWKHDLGDPGGPKPQPKVVKAGTIGFHDRIWEIFPELYAPPDDWED